MRHLSPDTFIALLDDTVAETAVPHLASCASCRQQLEELRAAWRTAGEAGLPEPSPLFWDHLSARVRDAVAGEPLPSAAWWRVGRPWRVAGLAAAMGAAVAVVVMLQLPNLVRVPEGPASAPASAEARATAAVGSTSSLAEDDSLVFVADLLSGLDWEAVSELGLESRSGADRVVAEMNGAERIELRRLLNEALSGGV